MSPWGFQLWPQKDSDPQPAFRTTTNHALGPPSLKLKSFKSCRTSNRVGSMLSTAHPSAKASRISFSDNRLGPWSPGSWSLIQSRKSRPPGLRTDASPSTYRRRSSSLKTAPATATRSKPRPAASLCRPSPRHRRCPIPVRTAQSPASARGLDRSPSCPPSWDSTRVCPARYGLS